MAGRPDPARVAAVDEDRFEMRPIAPRLSRLKTRLQRLLAPAATALLGAAALALPAAADAQPLQLRIVGGLASLNQYRLHEEPFWSHRLSTLTQGRIQAEIVPFDRAGIRGQDMLRLLQLGVVPFGTALLSLAATEDPLVNMADLPGANPDIDTLRRAVAAFRPVLDQHLRQALGVELLAVYAYPAQVLFCRQAFGTLADLAKRRVRVVSAPQADFIEAIGAQAVLAPFAEVLPKLRSGQLDCAITGTMSGNTVGLHEVTTHLHTMPITWGLSVFAANKAAWAGLFATRTRDEWAALLERSDACVAPVLDLTEVPGHHHAASRAAYLEVGDHRLPAPSPRFSRTPSQPGDIPHRGKDTDRILAELGYSAAEIARLRASHAVG